MQMNLNNTSADESEPKFNCSDYGFSSNMQGGEIQIEKNKLVRLVMLSDYWSWSVRSAMVWFGSRGLEIQNHLIVYSPR